MGRKDFKLPKRVSTGFLKTSLTKISPAKKGILVSLLTFVDPG